MLNVTKTIEEGKAVFALQGRLDTMTAPELERELRELPEDLSELILDFEKLDYLSSAGLRVLLGAQKLLAGKGEMKLIDVNRAIMDILEVTGFTDILTIE